MNFRQRPNGQLELAFPNWVRLPLLGFALVVGGAMALLASLSPVGLMLMVAALAGGLYEERWLVPAEGRELWHRNGLLFLHRTRRIAALQISSFSYAEFQRVPGNAERPGLAVYHKLVCSLVVLCTDGSSLLVELHTRRPKDDLLVAAQAWAERLDRPLSVDLAKTGLPPRD